MTKIAIETIQKINESRSIDKKDAEDAKSDIRRMISNSIYRKRVSYSKNATCLLDLFIWSESRLGMEFWTKINNNI